MRCSPVRAVSPAIVLAGAHAAAAQPFSLEGLGFLPSGSSTRATGVSADGSVVVGYGTNGQGHNAFRWTRAGGIVDLTDTSFSLNTFAYAVSGDGSTIVGDTVHSPFRWTQPSGFRDLGVLPGGTMAGAAAAASHAGSVIVGTSGGGLDGPTAFRWTAETGAIALGGAYDGAATFASGVSADGAAVVGGGQHDPVIGGRHAFRWTAAGLTDLGTLPTGSLSQAQGVSADGAAVVGFADSAGVDIPFRWTEQTGMVPLGTLADGHSAYAHAASANGSIVVGWGFTETSQNPFIWTADTGLVDLEEFLPTVGVDLTGWDLWQALDISADGTTVVGWGIHNGDVEAWVATIPAPGTAVLCSIAGVLIRRRR